MGALLFLPALLMNLNFHFGLFRTFIAVAYVVLLQLVVGAEFLLHDWKAYIGKAFEFDRVFQFKWSVNWQFWGEEVATGKVLAQALLAAHLTVLLVFLLFKWTSFSKGIGEWIKEIRVNELFSLAIQRRSLDPKYVILSLFTCNLIGIVCARSLHYQFYSWYYQQLPLILYSIRNVQIIFKYDFL